MIAIFWAVTLLAACASAFFLFLGLSTATGAPQQAAAAGVAVAVVVIPYVFTRAIEGIVKAAWRTEVKDILTVMRNDQRTGTENMNKHIDAVAEAVRGPAPLPIMSARPDSPGYSDRVPMVPKVAAGMGWCPGCGKLRGLGTAKCIYCESTAQVTEAKPT